MTKRLREMSSSEALLWGAIEDNARKADQREFSARRTEHEEVLSRAKSRRRGIATYNEVAKAVRRARAVFPLNVEAAG